MTEEELKVVCEDPKVKAAVLCALRLAAEACDTDEGSSDVRLFIHQLFPEEPF